MIEEYAGFLLYCRYVPQPPYSTASWWHYWPASLGSGFPLLTALARKEFRQKAVQNKNFTSRQLVVLYSLMLKIQILSTLYWCLTGRFDGLDPVQPLDTSCADVAHDNFAERKTMYFWQRLTVHLPSQEDFVGLDLGPWHGNDIIHALASFKARVCSVQLEMLGAIFETSAMFDDLLEADASPFCGTYRPFSPRSIDHFVTLARILADLLEPLGSAALNGHKLGGAWEDGFVLQISKSERVLGLLTSPSRQMSYAPGPRANVRYSAVVANKA